MEDSADSKPTDDELAGMNWWNSLSDHERATWLSKISFPSPAEAWSAFKAGREKRVNTQMEPSQMTPAQKGALERLITHAQRDSGQSRRVADFLLAWWNAAECGKFDLTDLWAVDDDIAADMLTVFGLVANSHSYPDKLGYGTEFGAIVKAWRPELK